MDARYCKRCGKGVPIRCIYLSPRKVSGVVVDIETIAQADIKSAFSSNAVLIGVFPRWPRCVRSRLPQFGHDFANKQGCCILCQRPRTTRLSERSQTITISSTTSGTVTGKTPVKQNAGVKTNKTWTGLCDYAYR